MTSQKKQDKARAKREKKQRKAELKSNKSSVPKTSSVAENSPPAEKPSMAVRYAEIVRGGLLLLTGASLLAALALGQRGVIMSLDDVINSLFAARTGKVLLALIALGLCIYGLKNLRLVK